MIVWSYGYFTLMHWMPLLSLHQQCQSSERLANTSTMKFYKKKSGYKNNGRTDRKVSQHWLRSEVVFGSTSDSLWRSNIISSSCSGILMASTSHGYHSCCDVIKSFGLTSLFVQRRESLTITRFLRQVQFTLHQQPNVRRHIGDQVCHQPRQEEHKMLTQITRSHNSLTPD